jgi:hypothetical protein
MLLNELSDGEQDFVAQLGLGGELRLEDVDEVVDAVFQCSDGIVGLEEGGHPRLDRTPWRRERHADRMPIAERGSLYVAVM